MPRRELLLESCEDRILCDAVPDVALSVPTSAKIGDAVQVTATFDNTSATDTGFGPYIDLVIDKTGEDGAGAAVDDGLTFTGATYLGQAVTATVLTFDASGQVTHPYAKDATGAALVVNAPPGYGEGDQLIVLQLPYGSFAPSQPPADVLINLQMSNLADANAPLNISARGGFQYGNDALDNSATDPSLIDASYANASITPSVMTLTKVYQGPEGETATGPNFVQQYRLVLDVANGQTLSNVHMVDVLAAVGVDAHQFVSLDSVTINGSAAGFTAVSTPSTTTPGGTLDVLLASVSGTASAEDAVVTFSFFVPRTDSAAGQGNAVVLEASTGDDNIISNQALGYGTWTPIDGRDSAVVVSDKTTVPGGSTPDVASEHDLEAQSIAIQKGVTSVIRNGVNIGAVAGNAYLPGDIVTFTLNFQISDYFAFQNLSITDVMSDGLHLDLTNFSPTLSINGNTYSLGASAIGAGNYSQSINTDGIYNNGTGTGNTTLNFNVAAELAARAASITATTQTQIADKAYASLGQLLGGGVNPLTPTGVIANNLTGYNAGGTTGQIVYQALILDKYTDAAPNASPVSSNEASLNPRDELTNAATIQGSVLDLAAAAANANNTDASGANNVLVSTGNTEADDTGNLLSIRQDVVQKEIYAVNGILNGTAAFNTAFRTGGVASGSINLRPGDDVTYRVLYTVPTGDVERLRFTDFLPSPIFSVTDPDANGVASGFTFTNNIVAGNPTAVIPAAGVVTYGSTHTLNDVAAVSGGSIVYDSGTPDVIQLTTDATSNSLSFNVGTTVDPSNTLRVVDLLFTVTVANRAFADGLFLTNQVQSGERNTRLPNQVNEANTNAIVQIVLNEPQVSINKGVVASTQNGAAPTTGGLTFNPVSGNGFSGTLTGAANATAIGGLNLTIGTLPDAGDLVRYALVAQNTGRSDAFDVTVQDTIRGSYANNYANATAFAAATNFRVYNGAGALQTLGVDYTLTWDNTTKVFQVTMIDTATDGHLNRGINATVAGSPETTDGSNAIVILYDLTVDADAQTGSTVRNTASLTKYTGEDGATGPGTNHAQQPLTESADVTIALPNLAKTFVSTEITTTGNSNTQAVIGELVTYTITVAVPEGTTANAIIVDTLDAGLAFVGITNVVGSAGVTASLPTISTTPTNTTIGTGGSSLTFNLGTITNTNTNNATAETITITYQAVVLNTNTLPSAPGNQSGSTLNNAAALTSGWTNDGVSTPATGTNTSNASAANVTVVEPALTASKGVVVNGAGTVGDAGDSIVYTITITNATGGATAFDLALQDILPRVTPGSNSISYIDNPVITSATGVSGVSGANFSLAGANATGWTLTANAGQIDIAGGETLVITITGTLAQAVAPALTLTNDVDLTWSSLNGTPGQRSLHNTASTERDGSGFALGAITGNQTASGSLNNYANSAVVTSTITAPANTKTIVATSESFTTVVGGTERVAIGEIVRYRLLVQIPEGTSTDLQVVDNLPIGMVFINDGTALVGFVSAANNITSSALSGVGLDLGSTIVQPTFILGDTAISTAAATNTDDYDSGTDVRFKLGNIVNGATSNGTAEYIVIEFNALVLNTFNTGNQSGTTLANNFTTQLGATQVGATSASVNVGVAEPIVTVAKAASTTGPVDAGDSFSYTITVSNTASGNNAAPAFDVRVRDLVDQIVAATNPTAELEFISYTTGTLPAGTTLLSDASSAVTDSLDLTFNRLNAGSSFTITVNVQVKTGAVSGAEIENKALVTFSSLPGTTGTDTGAVATTYGTTDVDLNPGTNSVLANADANNGTISLGANAGERTGADSEATANDNTPPNNSAVRNNYAVAANAPANLLVAIPTIDKQFQDGSISADDTSVVSSPGANVVIGETVTYDLLVTLPEGVTQDLRVLDNVPAGLRIDAVQIITDGSTPLVTTAFNGTFGTTPSLGAPVTGPTNLTLDFDNVTVADDNVAANNSFVIRVVATVLNISANQAGVLRTNTAQITFNDPDGSGNAGPAADRTLNDANNGNDPTVTIVEPTVTVAKSVSGPASPDAGDVLTYTITLTNNSGQTAYDLTLSDALSASLTAAPGFLGVVGGSSVTVAGGATSSANAFEIVDLGGGNSVLRTASGANVDLPNGGSITLTYATAIVAGAGPSISIPNLANVRWSSLDGGLDGDDAGTVNERNGSGLTDPAPTTIDQTSTAGPVDNYALSSSIVITATNNIVANKTIVTTSLGSADGVVTPGEIVTYRVTVTLPEGVASDLQIRDAIPPGMAYVPGTIVLDTTGYNGAVGALAVTPVAGITYLSGTDITFDFAAITTAADNIPGNNTFSFTYQAVVLDVVTNDGVLPGQTTLPNTATHNNGSGTSFATSAGGASVTVVEPNLQVTNTLAITGPQDAGAPFTYTITVNPTLNATSGAYEVSIADLLPAELGSLSLASAIVSDGATSTNVAGNFSLVGNNLSTTTPLSLLLNTNGANDQVLTITLTGTLSSAINPGETVNTSTALAYTGYPGDRTTVGGFDPNPDVITDLERTYTGSDTESFTTPNASFSKSLFSTDQAFTSGANLAIGENVTYALRVTLTEGTTPDLTVIDRLPAGLQYLSSSIVTDAASSDGLLSTDFGGVAPTAGVTGGAANGDDVTFTFGSISTTGDNDATNNSFLILVTARATNTLANQNALVLANDARFDISTDNAALFTTPVVNVTVVEPRINVTQIVTSATAGIDAGDSVTYQVTVDNLVGNGATADAFEVALNDVLPAGLLITSIGAPALSGGATTDTALSGTGTNNLTGTFDIPLGGSVTFTFTAQVPNIVTPGQTLTSDLNVTFSSLNGTDANERNGSNVADPEDNTPPTNNAVLNNYAVGADTTVTATNPFSVTKTLTDTSLGSDTSANVVVGETLTYQLAVGVMEGTTNSLSLVDALPRVAGVNLVTYVPGSVTITNANGMTINGFNAVYNAATNQLTITATSVNNPGGSNATINDPAVSETDTFFVTYQVQVANVNGNQSGTTLTNDVDATATDVPPDNNNAVTVTVREPVLTLDKTTTTPGTDGGDTVVYTLVIANTGNATAYDVSILDTLDAALLLTTPGSALSISSGPGYATLNQSGNTAGAVSTLLNQLNAGDTITITITAQVAVGAVAGDTISNSASISYSSLPGTQTGERDGSGGVNDYTITDASTDFTLAQPTIDKQTPADITYSIGETVTYDILITVPEGSTNGLIVTDNLPAGLVYTSFQVLTSGAPLASAFNGTVGTPTVGNPSGNTRTFDFGSVISTADNVAGNGTFVLRVTARVDNILANQGAGSPAAATQFSNTATLQYTDGTSGTTTVTDPTVPGAITVVEPVMTFDKAAVTSTANLDAGNTVQFSLTFANSGTATAHDVTLSDLLPPGMIITSIDSVSATGGASTDVAVMGLATGTLSGEFTIPVGGQVIVLYTVTLQNSVAPGTDLTNGASIAWTSIDGADANERTGANGPQGGGSLNDYRLSDSVTISTSSTLAFAKTLVSTSSTSTTGTDVAIGETADFDLAVTLQQGLTSVVTINDTLPTGEGYVTGSALFRAITSGATAVGAVSGTVYTDGAAINAADLIYTAGTGALRFNFGNVQIPGTAASTTGQFAIRYTALVQNVPANDGTPGTVLTNTANVAADRNGDGDTSDAGETSANSSQTINVVEPELAITKDFDVITANAGDTIEMTLTITNNGTSTGFDSVISDTIDGTRFDLSSFAFGSGSSGWSVSYIPGTGLLTLTDNNAAGLALGGTATFVFNVDLRSALPPGAVVSNTASATTTTLPGVDPNERTEPPVTATATLNASATVALDKTVQSTSETGTTGSNVAIGETAIFRLTVTLGEGVTQVVTFNDTLPAGVGYNAGSAVFRAVTAGATATGAVSGTLYAGGSVINAADLVYDAGTGALSFSLVDATIPAGSATGTGQFGVDYQVTVLDVLSNQNGINLTNSATVSVDLNADGDTADAGETSAPDSVTLAVVEPALIVTKTSNDPDGVVTAGETLTYTLTLTNSGTATAYDVLLRDVIPAGLLYVPGSVSLVSGVVPDASSLTVAGATLTANFASLAVGESSTITFQAVVQTTGSLTNNARIFYDGLAGDETDNSVITQTPDGTPDRDYGATGGFNGTVETPTGTTDPAQDTELVTLGTGTVGDRLWFDRDADAVQDGNEPGLAGVTVTLTVTNPDSTTYTLTTFTDANGNYTFANLAAGDYTITVDSATLPGGATTSATYDLDGIGTANTATLTLTNGQTRTDADFGYRGTGTLGDVVWLDLDASGTQNGQEPGIANATLDLVWDANGSGTIDAGDTVLGTTTTDGVGAYNFGNLLAGNYLVRVSDTNNVLTGATGTYDLDGVGTPGIAAATLTNSTQSRTDVDFGYRGAASISGTSYHDQLKNGDLDGTDTGIGGVTVELVWDQNNNGIDAGDPIISLTTAANGTYAFDSLLAGTYYVRETQPAGFGNGTENGTNLVNVNLPTASTLAPVDFGNTTGSIAGRVFVDNENNGVEDGTDTGLAGASVTLEWSGADGVFGNGDDRSVTVTTDASGDYLFDYATTAGFLTGFGDTTGGLLSTGSYRITEAQPAAYLDGAESAGNASVSPGAVDEGANPGFDGRGGADQIGVVGNYIQMAAGEDATGYTFGELPPASISGSVFSDYNNDGIRDLGEPGISGVTLRLTGIDDLGNPVDVTVTTDNQGEFVFQSLQPGTYEIFETQPGGYYDGMETPGTAAGSAAMDDVISGIVLTPGTQAVDYFFGEIQIPPPIVIPPEPSKPKAAKPDEKPAFVFSFDSFNNPASRPFGTQADAAFPTVSSIDIWRPAMLPIAPIYSGAANPGATLVIDLYNANGIRVASMTVVADTGGNWLANFGMAQLRDTPSDVKITQLNAPYGFGSNVRTYYAPAAINPGHFLDQISRGGLSDEAAPLLGGLDLSNPLQLGSLKYAGELLPTSGVASGQ